jgi:hypothetical protein
MQNLQPRFWLVVFPNADGERRTMKCKSEELAMKIKENVEGAEVLCMDSESGDTSETLGS